jgi:methanogenic corrinoid protein MtbC1
MLAAEDIDRWRKDLQCPGFWLSPRTMVTATIDDGIGQGIRVIERFGTAVGLKMKPLGLMQPVDAIIEACWRLQPDFLGLTVLQFDSEPIVAEISRKKPPQTILICGGPVFTADPQFAERAGVDHAAKNVASFLDVLLNLSASADVA